MPWLWPLPREDSMKYKTRMNMEKTKKNYNLLIGIIALLAVIAVGWL